ncbi:replication protein A 70 kDa DNA-binding subunit B [Tanacetum coccineum]
MVNQSFLISNINAVKDNFSINAKVVRLWRQYYYGGDTLASMDMILMDQEVEFLQYVIGLIAVVGDVIHGERKGKNNRRMVVELTDIEGLKLKCTLWDAWIDDFNTRMESSLDHIKVCVFQFGCVRKSVESISVSNTFYSSRFFINEEIPEIADFKSRLLARVGDDTSSLQVSNLTSESAEALQEKSFFYGTKYVNLDQLMDVIEFYSVSCEACACVALATITSIEYEEGNWKKMIRNTYRCETCGPDIVDVIPKFRVQVRVSDDSACASFLMFDRDVFNIVKRSAYELKEEEATKPNAGDYPEALNDLLGKTMLFRDVESSIAENMVKVEPVEFNATPPQGKRVIADVDKDKGAPSVTSRRRRPFFHAETSEQLSRRWIA